MSTDEDYSKPHPDDASMAGSSLLIFSIGDQDGVSLDELREFLDRIETLRSYGLPGDDVKYVDLSRRNGLLELTVRLG